MARLEPIPSSETDRSPCARRMRDQRPGEAVAVTPAPRETEQLLVDSADNAGRLFRAGTLFVALFNVLVMVSSLSGSLTREGYPAHIFSIVTAALGFLFTFTAMFRRNWRPLAFVLVCNWVIASVWIAAGDHNFDLLCYEIVLLMTGAGALVPWEMAWQGALFGGSVISYAAVAGLPSAGDTHGSTRWVVLLIAGGIAQVCVVLNNRRQREISSAVLQLHDEAARREAAIAELERTQKQLIDAREAALAASRAKSEFLSSMSHEIRTPMTAILGMADLIGETELDEEQRKFLDVMTNNGNSLLQLINDVLDLAKVESGRLTLEQVGFDLGDLMNTVGEALAVRAHEKGLELAIRVFPEAPAELVGDPLRIRQILINLVGNAVKFTERGSVTASVGLEPGDSRFLHFSVADTGIGIRPELAESIFSDFTQADASTTRQYGGSGLGLAIAKRLVAMMDGRIWVETELGKGSIFHFTTRFEPHKGDAVKIDRSVADIDLHGVRTLVVDDTPINRLIVREMLSATGAEVSEADSARNALAEIERASLNGRPYALLVLDYRMPVIDGIELMGMLRAKGLAHHMVVVMLTSDDLKIQLSRAHQVGLDAYLVKPIKRAELLDAVKMALGTAQARRKTAAHPVRPAADAPAADAPLATAPVSDSRMIRVLLAEDSRDNTMLIELFLRNTRYHLDTAENGEVAVAKFRAGDYDAVLMDINMPVMDGYAALREIRNWEREQKIRETPVIALTASAFREDAQRALAAGFRMHVAKPIKKATLTDALTEVTGVATDRGSGPDTDPAHLESPLR
ncbi:MAG: response regulator [Candidatus Binatales bacterium]